jgi:hypothetical protein
MQGLFSIFRRSPPRPQPVAPPAPTPLSPQEQAQVAGGLPYHPVTTGRLVAPATGSNPLA